VAKFFPIQRAFTTGREKEGLGKEGTGNGPSPIYAAIPPGQEGTRLLHLQDESLNPRVFVHGRGPDLEVRPKEVGHRFPGYERGRYHIDEADGNMKPFILTPESIAGIRARKLGIHGKEPRPIFDIVL
jgi:hypothetical protein